MSSAGFPVAYGIENEFDLTDCYLLPHTKLRPTAYMVFAYVSGPLKLPHDGQLASIKLELAPSNAFSSVGAPTLLNLPLLDYYPEPNAETGLLP
jgi:hypothetical protein